MSSDTAEKIGRRLADALVEQCADMGGSAEFFREALNEALAVIQERVSIEIEASKEMSG